MRTGGVRSVLRWLATPLARLLDLHLADRFDAIDLRTERLSTDLDEVHQLAAASGRRLEQVAAGLERGQRAQQTTDNNITALQTTSDQLSSRLDDLRRALDVVVADLTTHSTVLGEQLDQLQRDRNRDLEQADERRQRLEAAEQRTASWEDSLAALARSQEERLQSILDRMEAAPSPEVVTGIAETQARVLAHLAALQQDHDGIKEELWTSKRDVEQALEAGRTATARIQSLADALARGLVDAAQERTVLAESLDAATSTLDES